VTSTNGHIDVHAHLVPRSLLEDLHSSPGRFPGIDVARHGETFTVAVNGGAPTRPVNPGLSDLGRRLSWMDEQGVDTQLAGGWLDVFGYDLEIGEGVEWSRALTAGIVEEVADQPRIEVLGTVPLQDPVRAGEVLSEHRDAGLPGVMIATRAGGRELDDDAMRPFWEAADAKKSIVFLHPGFGASSERYGSFGLVNGLARLEDTTVTLARLLYAGIPARYPGAKIVVAHGGAALPFVLGRLGQNHSVHPRETADPHESFAHLYFDSVVFEPRALEHLAAVATQDRVLLGSDYPFPIGDLAPGGDLKRSDLGDDVKDGISRGNADALLKTVAR
jgi:aminocarboxymuconate-semialdehyde decarboxylase